MQMHWCICKVNLAGQGFTIFDFLVDDPVSWPEVQVISALHGEENVFDVKPVRVSETSARQEKDRLTTKYGYPVCERVFPGRSFRMEGLMPGEAVDQPQADDEGITVSQGEEPPMGSPVFKPGKIRPPSASP